MEPLWKLEYMLEPSCLLLICTAVAVVSAAAQRALSHEREAAAGQRNNNSNSADSCSSSITLDSSQALMIPLASSCTLLAMFYLFSSISQLVTLLTAAMAVASLAFCLSPYIALLCNHLGLGSWHQALLAGVTCGVLVLWLVSGHWLLNNLLGISICIAFVTHIRLPNVRVCTLLLSCLFFYDIFWVFLSERLFGTNVMVSVATQQASNPVHTVADKLNLPGIASITKKLELPVKIIFPRHLLDGVGGGGSSTASSNAEYMMLGLGDMAIPGMLLALVLCFDYRKGRSKYILFAQAGYALGLVCALAAGLLTRSAQPALLYLVPSTLGPVMLAAWLRGEFIELWNGPRPVVNEKSQLDLV